MKKRSKKTVEVQKFGGEEKLGETQLHGYNHDVNSIETQSKTTLEQDTGEGGAVIIRCFTFGINPEAFKQYAPTKQELFNSHYKGIEIALWKDGLKVMPDVHPRIVIDQQKGQYQIFVGAQPARGHLLMERPQTLSEIVNG